MIGGMGTRPRNERKAVSRERVVLRKRHLKCVPRRLLAGCALIVGAASFAVPGLAQWAIGEPGERIADAGEDRFVYIVFADPLPGQEVAFNDWYQNQHLGDLMQLEGWVGAQRFRLESSVSDRKAPDGSRRLGYAVLWDLEGADAGEVRGRVGPAITGGKSRKSPAFDYSPGAGSSTTYKAEGPRMTRPDGRKPFRPAASDNVTPRPDRFMVLEMIDPAEGIEPAAFTQALERYMAQNLDLPGWMAAQRFSFTRIPTRPGGPPFRLYPAAMIIWEVEGAAAPEIAEAREAALRSGAVTPLPVKSETRKESWWEPISPHVTIEDIFPESSGEENQ